MCHLYFGHYWLARHSFVARAAISAYVYAKNPPIALTDPTERLIAMMRDKLQASGGKFLVGLQKRDARFEAFFRAQDIPFATFEMPTPTRRTAITGRRKATRRWRRVS
ncbi:MAG: hypothetical protein V7604_858 [Hyphomicrobiales bacterium]|jgi:hypothetical protein